MTLAEVHEMLLSTGLPVAYGVFKEPQKPPYICYMCTDTDNFAADDKMYHNVQGIRVELYTDRKDEAAESAVETALSGLFWDSYESYIKDERLFQVAYEIEV